MKSKIIYIVGKVLSLFPFLRKPGAWVLTLIVKLRGDKNLSIYNEFRQREAQLQRLQDYQAWFAAHYPKYEKLVGQKDAVKSFDYQPKISILMPTYNTDHEHLKACIRSVLAQTYFNWELCIADDASPDEEVVEIIREFVDLDPRIKLVEREENGHICAATNSALEVATGEYVALLDHDDVLWPHALFEVVQVLNRDPDLKLIYTDEDKLEMDSDTHIDPAFKTDWNPDALRTHNYITHFATLEKSLVEDIGGFREGREGAQDWDLFLRATEAIEPEAIHHIPTVLYSWRKSPTSTAGSTEVKDYAYVNQKKALEDDLRRRGYAGEVVKTPYMGYWRVKYAIVGEPKVSIIIPTLNSYQLVTDCVNSILAKTSYENYEILLVDTGSKPNSRVWGFYDQLKADHDHIRILEWDKKFNFSGVCNFGAEQADGDYYLFLNNDTEVISEDWLQSMLEHAQREQVGAVGAKLLFADETIQHAGIVLGMSSEETIDGVAGHIFSEWSDASTYHIKVIFADSIRNYSAVTAACLMIDREKFERVGGFDEDFQIAFNDVDLCLRLQQEEDLFNVYTPHAKLYHYESRSVGRFKSRKRNQAQFEQETKLMGEKWGWEFLHNDSNYNPHLSLKSPYGMLRVESDPPPQKLRRDNEEE